MEVLVLGGKNYVKSSVVARELGYTSDYVGQLCRSGKVDAKLFGRTWYVDKDSIDGHKTTRYRSSKAVTKRVLHASLRGEAESTVAVEVAKKRLDETNATSPKQVHFYSHAQANDRVATRYSSDESHLIPKPDKATHAKLRVDLADAEKVSVTAPQEKYTFEVPTLPEIRFKGRLQVSNVEEESEQAITEVPAIGIKKSDPSHEAAPRHFHPKEVSQIINKKPKNKVISSKKKASRGEEHLAVHEVSVGGPVLVYELEGNSTSSFLRYFLHTLLALLLGAVVSVSSMMFVTFIEYTTTTQTSTIRFVPTESHRVLAEIKKYF